MNRLEMMEALRKADEMGVYVLRRRSLRAFFPGESDKTFAASLSRMIDDKLLVRAASGVYVNERSRLANSRTVERVALALRPADHVYLSLESALSEYGVISQITIDRLTVMTTGRSGEVKTPYGVIEFTHTKRKPQAVREGARRTANRPMPLATIDTALRDLKRVGRNTHLVNMSMLREIKDDASAVGSGVSKQNKPSWSAPK